MFTDNHCHILPRIDDGARDSKMALAMLEKMRSQGVDRVVATPHFYAHHEKSVEGFLKKRDSSYHRIRKESPLPIRLGAEVAIEYGLSYKENINKLAIEGTNVILLELPYRRFESWMPEEIETVASEYGLTVMLAHIHRYLSFYSRDDMERILDLDVIFQVNNEAFKSFREKLFIRRLIKEGREIALGSDSHNLMDRRPNWEIVNKKADKNVIENSNTILDRYSI